MPKQKKIKPRNGHAQALQALKPKRVPSKKVYSRKKTQDETRANLKFKIKGVC